MNSKIRLLPLAVSVLVFTLAEIALRFSPEYIPLFWYVLAFANAVIIISAYLLVKLAGSDTPFLYYALLPVLAYNTVSGFTVFAQNQVFINLSFLGMAFVTYVYFKYVYKYLYHPKIYIPESIETFSFYTGLLFYFFASSIIFGLQSFLNTSVWISVLFLAGYTSISVLQLFWANGFAVRQGIVFNLVIALIMLELAWSISFLPFNYLIAAFLATVHYYMIISLVKMHLSGPIEKRSLAYTLNLGFFAIIIVLLTSRWL